MKKYELLESIISQIEEKDFPFDYEPGEIIKTLQESLSMDNFSSRMEKNQKKQEIGNALFTEMRKTISKKG